MDRLGTWDNEFESLRGRDLSVWRLTTLMYVKLKVLSGAVHTRLHIIPAIIVVARPIENPVWILDELLLLLSSDNISDASVGGGRFPRRVSIGFGYHPRTAPGGRRTTT